MTATIRVLHESAMVVIDRDDAIDNMLDITLMPCVGNGVWWKSPESAIDIVEGKSYMLPGGGMVLDNLAFSDEELPKGIYPQLIVSGEILAVSRGTGLTSVMIDSGVGAFVYTIPNDWPVARD